MPKYLLTHEDASFFTEEKLKELSKADIPEGIVWEKSYCSFEQNKSFCLWQAPSPEIIKQLFNEANLPIFDAIYPVEVFNPAKGKLE